MVKKYYHLEVPSLMVVLGSGKGGASISSIPLLGVKTFLKRKRHMRQLKKQGVVRSQSITHLVNMVIRKVTIILTSRKMSGLQKGQTPMTTTTTLGGKK